MGGNVWCWCATTQATDPFDSMSAVVQAAEQGVGIALVSAPLAAARFAAGTLRKIVPNEFTTGESYYLVARHNAAQRADVQSLVNWLLQQFGGSEAHLDVVNRCCDAP